MCLELSTDLQDAVERGYVCEACRDLLYPRGRYGDPQVMCGCVEDEGVVGLRERVRVVFEERRELALDDVGQWVW